MCLFVCLFFYQLRQNTDQYNKIQCNAMTGCQGLNTLSQYISIAYYTNALKRPQEVQVLMALVRWNF